MRFKTKSNYRCVCEKHDKKVQYWQKFWLKEGKNGWSIIYKEIRKMMGELVDENKIIRKIADILSMLKPQRFFG